MNDQELDRLIAQANPFGTDTVRQLPVAGAESDLLEDIMTTTTAAPVSVEQPQRPRRRRALLVAAAAAVIAAGVGIGGALFPNGNPAAPPSAYAAQVVAVAEANPRLLLDKPGWKVIAIAQFTKEEGEMHFGNGTQGLIVNWRPADQHASFVTGYGDETTQQPIELLGQRGTLFATTAGKVKSTSYFTVLPPKGVNFLTITAIGGSAQAYRDLLAALRPVDVKTWLDALPASAVKADDTARVVTEMLADIKVPAGFDPKPLHQNGLDSRYNLGATVTSAVTCSWIKEWDKAKAAGDTAGVQTAVAAMRASKSWKVLLEMRKGGDFSRAIWEIADAMAKGTLNAEDRASVCR